MNPKLTPWVNPAEVRAALATAWRNACEDSDLAAAAQARALGLSDGSCPSAWRKRGGAHPVPVYALAMVSVCPDAVWERMRDAIDALRGTQPRRPAGDPTGAFRVLADAGLDVVRDALLVLHDNVVDAAERRALRPRVAAVRDAAERTLLAWAAADQRELEEPPHLHSVGGRP